MGRLIRTRKLAWTLGPGSTDYRLVEHPHADDVLSLRYDGPVKGLLVLHNLSPRSLTIEVPDLGEFSELVEPFSDRRYEKLVAPARDRASSVDIGPYGYRWVQLHP